jgi:Glycine cleavage system P-protein
VHCRFFWRDEWILFCTISYVSSGLVPCFCRVGVHFPCQRVVVEAHGFIAGFLSLQFLSRHLGPRDSDITKMLSVVGDFASLDALTKSTVPSDILFDEGKKLGVPGPMTETEALVALKHIASKNQVCSSSCAVALTCPRREVGTDRFLLAFSLVLVRFSSPSWAWATTAR